MSWLRFFFPFRNCNRDFCSLEYLERHSINCIPSVKMMTCPICDGAFKKDKIYTHVSTQHPVHFHDWFGEGRCFLCKNSPEEPLNLPMHWFSVHKIKLVPCETDAGQQNIFVPVNGKSSLVSFVFCNFKYFKTKTTLFSRESVRW